VWEEIAPYSGEGGRQVAEARGSQGRTTVMVG